MPEQKTIRELLEQYPEWVAFIKYFEGIATPNQCRQEVLRRIEEGEDGK